jgi:hypothetical protein
VFAISKDEEVKNSKSIKKKLGITTKDGTPQAVTDTFNALHEFIKAGGLTNENTKEMIKPGDWIDLEGGLTVAAYPDVDGVGDFTYPGTSTNTRLIVVGINSFKTDKTVNENYVYPKASEEDDPPPHVVFQFQNLPVMRRMNNTDLSVNGYPASEMRKYLTPVDQVDGSGNFLAGLLGAGVPEGVLWAPSRMVSARATYKSNAVAPVRIRDKVWLPTEWEMFGYGSNSQKADETNINQVWLGYYADDERRKKFDVSQTAKAYWLASQYNNSNYAFCLVTNAGQTSYGDTEDENGVAPAFCVY